MTRRVWRRGRPAFSRIPLGDEVTCDCRVCLSYRNGATSEQLAEEEGLADARPILRLLEDHGTPRRCHRLWPRTRKAGRDKGPPMLALALAVLLPLLAYAKGHGGIVKVETAPWAVPAEMIRDGFSVDASAVIGGNTTDTIRLNLPLEGPGRLRYRAVLRKQRKHGSKDWTWLVSFERVEEKP